VIPIVWELPGDRSFELKATTGKPLDVLELKGTSLDDVRAYALRLAGRAKRLYSGPVRRLERCPCCRAGADEALPALEVYGVAYVCCLRCGHAFVREQPAIDVLEKLFAEDEELSATYTDREAVEVRLAQIVRPKLDWTLAAYRRQRGGRAPATGLDVGAGGGHFVAAAREAGVAADGFELSQSSREFAADFFGIELRAVDFLTAGAHADLITFWGLLEYVPEPRRFLEAARAALPADGMLIVEVPRFDCLGTAVQAQFPDTVARHLDPTSHVNCFSDVSLAVALAETGFRPVEAWYFGMDAYELAVQLALHLGDELLPALAGALLPLQEGLDAARYCDDIVVAALPET
jgi:SAM-dependent methyltransferase